MRSVKSEVFFLCLLGVILFAPGAFAAEGEFGTASDKSDLSAVKARLTALEEGQKEILAKEDIILAKLDQLRVWVHRK
jgi:hypothetical protein